MDTQVSLLNPEGDSQAVSIAQRLAKRTKQQWYLSIELAASEVKFYRAIEQRILEHPVAAKK
jgi:hypothetical protein